MPKPNRGATLKWREERGVWEIEWFEHGRRRRKSARTADLPEAQRELAGFLLKQEAPGPRDPAQRRIADMLNDYLEEHAPHTADPARITYAVDALMSFWESRFVDDIAMPTCRAYRRFRGVSDGTVIRELTTLRAAMGHDFRMGRLTQLRAVWTPEKPPVKAEWLERHEVAALLRSARRHKRSSRRLPFYMLMLFYTGARRSYPVQLRAQQVDLQRALIDYSIPGQPQTKKHRPVVPIARPLMTFMRIYMKRAGATGHLIRSLKGRPYKSLKKALATVVKDAGLEGRVTPKTFRHTFASLAIQNGVPPWKVAKALGHTTSRMVETTYGHLAPDHLRDVVDYRRPASGAVMGQ